MRIVVEFKDKRVTIESAYKFNSHVDVKSVAIELIKETIKALR